MLAAEPNFVTGGLEELGAEGDDALRVAVLTTEKTTRGAPPPPPPAARAAFPARWLLGGAVAGAFATAWWRLAGRR